MKATMNKQTAYKLLTAAAPVYAASAGTKKALRNYNAVNNNWKKLIRSNIEMYNNMGDFDPEKSATYQAAYASLRQAYKHQGERDMENALASGALASQGRGNSYAATAANAAYQSRLSALAAQVPNLYKSASEEFNEKKQALANTIAMQQQRQQEDLARAQFALDAWQKLDEKRYNSVLQRDKQLRENALLYLQLIGGK